MTDEEVAQQEAIIRARREKAEKKDAQWDRVRWWQMSPELLERHEQNRRAAAEFQRSWREHLATAREARRLIRPVK